MEIAKPFIFAVALMLSIVALYAFVYEITRYAVDNKPIDIPSLMVNALIVTSIWTAFYSINS